MDILRSLLSKEVQVKKVSDVDVKALQKKLKKKGLNYSIEELKQRLQEYDNALEERRVYQIKLISFISMIVMLIVLAIELQLRNMNIFVLSNIDHIFFTVAGFSVIGGIWLRGIFLIKKKNKIARIILICTALVLICLIAAAILI